MIHLRFAFFFFVHLEGLQPGKMKIGRLFLSFSETLVEAFFCGVSRISRCFVRRHAILDPMANIGGPCGAHLDEREKKGLFNF